MRKKAIIAFLVVGLLLSYGLLATCHALVMTEVRSGRTCLAERIQPGDQFSLQFQHSMYDVPQWEYYLIDSRYRMILQRVVFGSGQAADYYECRKLQAEYRKGRWVIDGIGQEILRIVVAVPMKQDMRLNLPDRTVILPNEIEPGTSVLIKIRRCSVLGYLAGKVQRLFY